MKALTNQQNFASGFSGDQGFFVDMTSGAATLQVETPDGWKPLKVFEGNTLDVFAAVTTINYRFVLSGGAKAYLV